MNDEKQFKSYLIPSRQVIDDKEFIKEEKPKVDIQAKFVEIEIQSDQLKQKLIEQKVEPLQDNIRVMFQQMRYIAKNNIGSYIRDDAKIFYQQALFMKDFEDDYPFKKEFFAYFPYFQLMGYEQLRTYFTWRTQVRKNIINSISLSYVFLYIYELINNIGVDYQEGCEKLVNFWLQYRNFDTAIDRYVIQWLKDYHVYYPLNHSFIDFVNKYNLKNYYPMLFTYKNNDDTFELFSQISDYKIKKSTFYEGNEQLIIQCVNYIINQLRSLYGTRKRGFDDLIFFAHTSQWRPFGNALFHPWLKNNVNRQVIISETEIYEFQDGNWKVKTLLIRDSGKKLLGYITKKIEEELRSLTKYKHKLSTKFNDDLQKIVDKIPLEQPLSDFLINKVKEFYNLYNYKKVIINPDNLNLIRSEALKTQEKLIVPDDSIYLEPEKVKEEIKVSTYTNIWQELLANLIPVELEALKLIINQQNLKSYVIQNNLMLEVLIDGINEKAMDIICDTILEIEDDVIIYDEYKERLKEVMI